MKNLLGGGPLPFKKVWGNATALLSRYQKAWWIDVILLLGLVGLIFGMANVAREWTGVHRPKIDIDLSLWALPKYTFFSLCRGLLAYLISLVFTLVYAYWAAKDPVAEKVLIPLLDILQSIPVLTFMPPLVLALVYFFPTSNVGLELAAVIMMFTGQVWNMTFSLYQSLRTVPHHLEEAATVYRFNWFQKATKLELPFAAIGLVWNSMMSMAGGWFFLTVNEAFQLGDKDFRLPGLGSYMSVAVANGDWKAQVGAVVAMTLMIVALDQFLWRPLVVWAQKFRVEEGSAEDFMHSWFLDFLRRSQIFQLLEKLFHRKPAVAAPAAPAPAAPRPLGTLGFRLARGLSLVFFLALVAGLLYGAWKLLELFRQVDLPHLGLILGEAAATLGRVLAAVAVSALWTIPVGLWIGLSPRLSRIAQPIVQIVASFPAPMLFPIVLMVMKATGVALAWGSIFLMILGTQWYILFNVVAGAMAIPSDLRESAKMFHITGWRLFRKVLLPGIFPFLVTGMITAAGNAWNTSIVSEYVTDKGGQVLMTFGLGAQITDATNKADYPMLVASTVVMAFLVVSFNRLFWKRLYRLAEEKYALGK